MADPAEVRRVIQERIMGVLRTEIAEIGGSADEIASRLLVHPSFESALEDLREHAAPSNSPGSGYSTPDSFAEGTRVGEQQHQRPSTARGDSNPPSQVVWTFDSDDETNGSGSVESCGARNSPRNAFTFEEWNGGSVNDAAFFQQLAVQMTDTTVAGTQRQRSIAELSSHQASEILCDQHWPSLLKALGVCLVDKDQTVRTSAADELCRLFSAAVPGPLAVDILSTLGLACNQSLHRDIPMQELAGRVHFFTRGLVAISCSWESLTDEQSTSFVDMLSQICRPLALAPSSDALPSMLALFGLVDAPAVWARKGLARLGLRHAVLEAFLDAGTLEQLVSLVQALPSVLRARLERSQLQSTSSQQQGKQQRQPAPDPDWQMLEVCVPT